MNITRKIALGLSGTALVLGSALGVAGLAHAETPDPRPVRTQAQDCDASGDCDQNRYGNQNRAGDGTRQAANPDAGLRNGGGYGAQAGVARLAEELGVSQDALRAALAEFHADNPGDRGADLSASERADRHAKLAAFLADELKLEEAKVREALDARAANGPARDGAGAPGGRGNGQMARDGSGPNC